jgi:hypothetical protein
VVVFVVLVMVMVMVFVVVLDGMIVQGLDRSRFGEDERSPACDAAAMAET